MTLEERKKQLREEHIKRHRELHRSLDELIADWIKHTESLPSKCTVLDLMNWSFSQTQNPTVKE